MSALDNGKSCVARVGLSKTVADSRSMVGFGVSSPIRRVVSHRLQSAETDRSPQGEVTGEIDPKQPIGGQLNSLVAEA